MNKDKNFDIIDTAKKLGITILKAASAEEFIARCPFCGDSKNPKHGHLYLNISKGLYHCVRCGEGGDVVDLYTKLTGLSRKDAYNELLNSSATEAISYEAVEEMLPKIKHNSIAPIEIRDKVYRAFLDKLVLEPHHRKNLLKRGLSWEETSKNLYKSLPDNLNKSETICRKLLNEGYSLKGIPGFYQKEEGERIYWTFIDYAGFLIPVKDTEGRIQGFQIRLDDENQRKYVWFSSRDKLNGTPAHAWQGIHGSPSDIVVITEGPLKADLAHYMSNVTFISIPGVTAIKGIEVLLKQMNAKKIYLAFDMDILTNPAVQKAKTRLEEKLIKAGFKVATKTWDPAYKGIDDYLLMLTKRKNKNVVWEAFCLSAKITKEGNILLKEKNYKLIELWGTEVWIEFSKHAFKRTFQRDIAKELIIIDLKNAEEELGSLKNEQEFIIIDTFANISIVGKLLFYGSKILIITVINKGKDIITKEGDITIKLE